MLKNDMDQDQNITYVLENERQTYDIIYICRFMLFKSLGQILRIYLLFIDVMHNSLIFK